MKESPISFSDEMVRAILEGRKTQTRRVVKPQPGTLVEGAYHRPDGQWVWTHLPVGKGVRLGGPFKCPYGTIDDRLIVERPNPITLENTGARVERVQEISVKDAIAEGIRLVEQPYIAKNDWALRDFRNLWDSIYAARGFGWDTNPWVWVIEFRRVL